MQRFALHFYQFVVKKIKKNAKKKAKIVLAPLVKKAQLASAPLVLILKYGKRRKIFCVGLNKTGTTSLAKALKELGFAVAPQKPAELLIHDWAERDFRRLFRFCLTAEAFQDIPFSLPFTYQALDMKFPGSKFILTLRDSPEQWYTSLTTAHAKGFGHGKIPTIFDLKNAKYRDRYPGYVYESFRLVYATPLDDPYHKATLIEHYNRHNENVMEYFRHRPDDLLVLNVAEEGAYKKLCDFLEVPCEREEFPWENKTADNPIR